MFQLLLHLIGDYVTQSHWMAENKTKRFWPAFMHALTYSIPFYLAPIGMNMLLEQSNRPGNIPLCSIPALLVIFSTHFFIDRYRLARYVVWLKNICCAPRLFAFDEADADEADYDEQAAARHAEYMRLTWSNSSNTGFPSDLPPWLSVWLLIIVDNTMHLTINYLALSLL